MLVEQAADGIFVATEAGVYVEVNASGNRLLGFEPGELIGKRIADVIQQADLPRLEATIARVLGGTVQTQEWQMLRKDGTLLDCEVTSQRLGSGGLLAIVRDLGARKAIEAQVRDSEARLRSILETAPDVIMTVDRDGKILFINRTLPPLTPSQVVGTICYDYVLPESRHRVAAALERVFSSKQPDEYEVRSPPVPTASGAGPRCAPVR